MSHRVPELSIQLEFDTKTKISYAAIMIKCNNLSYLYDEVTSVSFRSINDVTALPNKIHNVIC